MSNSLTRIVVKPVLLHPGTPGTPGTPARPAKAAYTVTETYIGWVYGTISGPLPGPALPAGAVAVNVRLYVVGGIEILETYYKIKSLVTKTTTYPPVEASPEIPPTPGTPPIYSTAGTIGWNGGARSLEGMYSGAVSFRAATGTVIVGAAAGLRTSYVEDYRFASIDFGFYLSGGIAKIIERGVIKPGSIIYTGGGKFSIGRAGGTVFYYHNDTLIQKSAATLTGRAYLNASLYAGGDSLIDAEFGEAVASASASAEFRPLASVADEGTPGTSSFNYLLPMTSEAESETPVTSVNTMMPLSSLSGDVIYAEGRNAFAPMTSHGIDLLEPVPTVTIAAASFYPLLSSSIMDNPPAVLPPAFTLTVEDVLWAESEWVGFTLHIVSGTGSGQSSLIVGSLEQALILDDVWSVLPDSTSRFEIRLGATVLLAGISAALPSTFLPMVSLAAETEYAGARGSLLPMTSLSLVTEAANITAILTRPRRPWLNASGHDATGENAFSYTAKHRELIFRTGHQAKITTQRRSLTASGTGTSLVGAILSAPKARIIASGTVSAIASAVIRSVKARIVISQAGVIAQVSRNRATVQSSVTTGGIASAQLTAHRPRIVATVTAEGQISALLVAPRAYLSSGTVARLTAPKARIVARVSGVVVVAYDAYSVNLKHADPEANDEVTSYTNFPFDRILRYGSSYYGVAADGLYLLEGTTDDSEDIAYAVKTCIDDFEIAERKTVVSAHFSGRMGPGMTVTLYAGEDGSESYAFNTPRGQVAQNHREKFGRGVKNRYFAIGMAGSDAFDLDSLDPEITKLKRRI